MNGALTLTSQLPFTRFHQHVFLFPWVGGILPLTLETPRPNIVPGQILNSSVKLVQLE